MKILDQTTIGALSGGASAAQASGGFTLAHAKQLIREGKASYEPVSSPAGWAGWHILQGDEWASVIGEHASLLSQAARELAQR